MGGGITALSKLGILMVADIKATFWGNGMPGSGTGKAALLVVPVVGNGA